MPLEWLDGGIRLRPGQAEAVRKIKDAFARGVKTVFLDAPVGSGKSLINLLVAREMKGAYISTPQVILVNQYGADTRQDGKFAGLAETLYGRRNYPCTHLQSISADDGGRPYATAAGAPCTYLAGWPRECPNYSSCPYYSAKSLAQAHHQTVTTLAYLLTGIRFGLENPSSGWGERPLLAIDEAHGMSEELVRYFNCQIGPKSLPGFRRKWLESPADPRFQLLESLPPYLERLRDVLSKLQYPPDLTPKIRRRIERIHSIVTLGDDLVNKLHVGTVEWVHTFDKRRIRHSWRPLSVGKLLESFWGHFSHVLLGSATFFGLEGLVRDTGLPLPFERVTVPDFFDPARAPIRLLSAARLGYRADPTELDRAADAVDAVAKFHRNERGVVHANSYQLANAIRTRLSPETKERITAHDPENRSSRYSRWKADPAVDAIFLGVAMSQGLDLIEDLARWQVVVKAPFPNLGDVWVRRRKEQVDGDSWYASRTIIDVLQASGRIMRSAEDRGVTYVVDQQLNRLVESGWPDLPEWFRRRVEVGRKVSTQLPGKLQVYG